MATAKVSEKLEAKRAAMSLDRDHKIGLLLAATRRERDLTASRASATQTRASLLVGASGLVASGNIVPSGPWWIPVTCFVLAALLGIWALVPDSAMAVRTHEMWKLQKSYPSSVDLHEQILVDELAADSDAAKVVKRRSILVILGFILFAIGVGASASQFVAATLHPSPVAPVLVEIVE